MEQADDDRDIRLWIIRHVDDPSSHKNRKGLADHLNISPSAVTQMLMVEPKVYPGGRVTKPRSIGRTELRRIEEYLGEDAPAGGRSIVGSFDPDADESPFDPDQAASRGDFPKDAIVEIEATAGMGGGEVVRTAYRREADGIVASDALKDDYWRFPESFVRHDLNTTPDRLLIAECKGDSMLPTLRPGEKVIVNTTHKIPSPDGLYAIRDIFGEIIVKRLQVVRGNPPRLQIISDNAAHPNDEVDLDDISIIGRVLFSLQRF